MKKVFRKKVGGPSLATGWDLH